MCKMRRRSTCPFHFDRCEACIKHFLRAFNEFNGQTNKTVPEAIMIMFTE